MIVSEVSLLTRENADLDEKNLKIIGKNKMERNLYYSTLMSQALWKHMNSHEFPYVFLIDNSRQLERHNIR